MPHLRVFNFGCQLSSVEEEEPCVLVGVGYQVFVSGGLGVLQVGMSKFVQHTNHLPEKKLDKL